MRRAERRAEATWQDKSQRWAIKIQADGQRKSFYSSTPGKRGKAEAEHKADAWLDGERQPERTTVTVEQLAELYLSRIRTGNGSGHKTREEATLRLYLLPAWSGRKVSSLTCLDYQDAIDACVNREKPLSARTCGHARSTITALWRFARKAKIPMQEPFGLTIPPGATKGQRHILQPDDVKKLFGPALDGYHYAPVYRFIVLTGLRIGEVCGLQMDDLDNNVLTIRRARNAKKETTSGKNENARRTIVLPEPALDVIRKHHAARKAAGVISPWLFCNTKGQQLASRIVYNAWQENAARAGIAAVSLHELRHTMISLCKDAVPLPVLKAVVGHSEQMDTLGTYGHDVDGEKAAAAAQITAVFSALLK